MCRDAFMVSFLGMVKLPQSNQWMMQAGVGVLAQRLLHVVLYRMPRHHLCHHLETCKYSSGKVTQYLHLHFPSYDFNIDIAINHFPGYFCVET